MLTLNPAQLTHLPFFLFTSLLFGTSSSQAQDCQPYVLEETFPNGDFSANWDQVAGIDATTHAPGPNGGVTFTATDAGPAFSFKLVSKAGFAYGSTVAVQTGWTGTTGVISTMVLWPLGGEGLGEIDLELFGGRDKSWINCPIYPPGASSGSGWLTFANQPGPWGTPGPAEGPIVEFPNAAATPANSINVVSVRDYQYTAMNKYQVLYTQDNIKWTLNDNTVFANYKKGTNGQWTGDKGPFHINLGMWANASLTYSPMSDYKFDAANPPSMTILKVYASGCAFNVNPGGVKQSGSADRPVPSISKAASPLGPLNPSGSASGSPRVGASNAGNTGNTGIDHANATSSQANNTGKGGYSLVYSTQWVDANGQLAPPNASDNSSESQLASASINDTFGNSALSTSRSVSATLSSADLQSLPGNSVGSGTIKPTTVFKTSDGLRSHTDLYMNMYVVLIFGAMTYG